LTKLDGELANESLDDLPGINIANNGEYAAELDLVEELRRAFPAPARPKAPRAARRTHSA
jgi:hypothetical protein